MAGENPEETRTGAPDEFLSRTKWERFQVLIMGPVMNLVLAVLVMAVVLFYRGVQDPIPAVVGLVQAGSAAEKAGILPGDRVLAVNDREVDEWDRLDAEIGTQPN